MGTPLTGLSPAATRVGLLKTTDNLAMSATIRNIGDGAGNDSGLYLGINKVGFNEAVNMTATSTQLNALVANNSGSNTGDETTATIKTKLGITTLSGSNTGDQDLSPYLTIANAASTYLTQSNATSTYLTQANATSTYQPIGAYLTDVGIADINATGTPNSSTFLRGDGTWATPAGGGGGDLLAANNLSDLANAATARTNLGLAIGTNVQAYSSNLTSFATVTPSANGLSFVSAADYTAMKALLGLVIGTNVQAYDADLTTWAGITPAANVGTWLSTPSSANLRAAVTDETGSGSLVFATSPTLVTPTLGVASATTINKVTITAPATASTLTIQNGFTLTVTGNANVTGTNSGDETLSSINALAITTVGAVGTGTWNATEISAIKGGTGLTTYTTGDLIYASATNTLSKLAAGTNTYVLTMSGGVPTWAAGGGGGGSSVFSDLTAATATNTINHAAYNQEWQWNSLVTGGGLNFTSSSTALTGTTFGDVADAVVSIKSTGASAASNIVSKSLYVSNTKTGTGSTNYAGYFTTESGNGIVSTALVAVGYQGGGFQFGAASSSAGGIWSWAVTPSTSNYAMIATSTDTNINATGTVGTRINGSTRLFVNTTGVTCGNANGVYGKLNVLDTPTASGNLGLICFGSNIQFTGLAAGTFGRPAGTAGVTSNTNGTVLAMNVNTGYTGDLMNLQYYGSSRLRLAHDGQLSINVEMKADVSASAIFQVDSTTKGFLPPRMTGTQAEAISSPATGLLVFSTDGSGSVITSLGWWGYSGSAWVKLN